MPYLLSRKPFHHDHDHEHSPNSKSSRGFLNFMNRRHSNDSIRSERSSDSLHSSFSPHGHGAQHQNFNLGEFLGSGASSPKHSHSMAELKRFFKPKLHRKASSSSHQRPVKPSASTLELPQNLVQQSGGHIAADAAATPVPQQTADHHVHTQSAIPPSSDSTLSLSNRVNIYHDDSILAQKYGKLGRVLGSGAGGSVKVLYRPSDNAMFAVKEFRPRKQNESVRDYARKCTAEFCIGSTLLHPNIIETMDIFSDTKQDKYFEVMEYAPVDFFAVVMTGKMSRGEINCCLKQIVEGVKYLHSLGLAHRDLKLDNCVMTMDGILKLIDFGSSVVFRYPMETGVTPAHGIVGSDPYLAPEVLSHTKCYEPQCADIWSIGIIYCCMMLKRFPWKVPRDTDENFKLFCMPDNEPHDYAASAKHHEQLLKEREEERHRRKNLDEPGPESQSVLNKNEQLHNKSDQNHTPDHHDYNNHEQNDDNDNENEHHDHRQEKTEGNSDQPSSKPEQNPNQNLQVDAKPVSSHAKPSGGHRKSLHGPYRLLRLLPHASRPLLSRILEIDPKKRVTMKEIYEDEWFNGIMSCTMRGKQVIRASGHHHTLVKEDENHTETFKV
ncbi:serine/threonine protein kinase [Zygosaccharomyces mellis]|uniref:non-specific serine/threonine protein kinase n=1 Tax=Zygosaccharomyces mellis TaxID=42258 RepID=A0A4C2E994_9SACH|nr:serine/threonine protein kinase [Zygosaccharomyces mellis]